MTIREIKEKLAEAGYIATDETSMAVYLLLTTRRPLLVSGNPGCGKTSLGRAVAKMLDTDLIMLPLYDGISPSSILWEFDYQRQLLMLNGIRPVIERETEGMGMNEALRKVMETDLYTEEFLLKKPVLKSITMEKSPVLLIDEVDKASEEIEHALYEFLDSSSLSIPQYGTITCPEDRRPFVILTRNDYRDLTEPLKRRCNYLHIKDKTADELCAVFERRTQADAGLCRGVAEAVSQIAALDGIEHKPSAAEGIAWIECLQELRNDPDFSNPNQSLGAVAKNEKDLRRIEKSGIAEREIGKALEQKR